VKPAPFDYRVASDLGHAVELLDGSAHGAKALAGGQSLVPLMNLRRIMPGIVVDISRCRESSGIRDEGDSLAIGALATYRSLEESALVRSSCGLLGAALGYVGSPAVRNRGTIGGSLSHADPTAELPTVVAALGGELTVVGPRGERRVAFEEFCTGPFEAALGPAELVSEVRLPKLPGDAGYGFVEVSRRYASSAQMAAATVIELTRDGVSTAWIAVSGLASVPTRARLAEQRLRGRPPTDEAFDEAAVAAGDELVAVDDDPYRRQLARVVISRALAAARLQATGS
jgi:aerobic carbon-monoxide dehydrogenase medium subunit